MALPGNLKAAPLVGKGWRMYDPGVSHLYDSPLTVRSNDRNTAPDFTYFFHRCSETRSLKLLSLLGHGT
jgi:hypothetical protein